jgi:hypothetical protein
MPPFFTRTSKADYVISTKRTFVYRSGLPTLGCEDVQHDEFVITAADMTPVGIPGKERDTISFDLRHKPHMGYPEHASGHHVMMFANDQSSMASPAMVRAKPAA